MARFLLALLAVLASAAAFAPAVGTKALRQVQMNGYVPDGLTPAQWADKQKAEAAAKAANKKRNWGVGRTGQEKSLTEFQAKRDAKYPNTPGAGHAWAKAKFFSYRDARVGGDARSAQTRAEQGKR